MDVEALRKQALGLAGYGVPTAAIAAALGLAEPDLLARFGREIQAERAKTTALVGQSLVQRAIKGEGREAIAAAQAWLRESRMVAPAQAGDDGPHDGSARPIDVGGGNARVNKAELAEILRCSLPTLSSLIKRYDDFPVLARGRNGESWQFDPEAVTAFLRAEQEKEEAELAARAEALDQFRLPGLEPAPTPAAAKPKDILDTLRAKRLQHDMAKQAGHLVWTTQVRQQLVTAITALNTFLHGLPGQCGRRFNLPDAVVNDMARLIADQQVEFQRHLRELLTPPADAA